MLDYPAIAAVSAVVKAGSFERAAAMLGITPSAVSQRVRGLEERLGAMVVVRGQPCTATELGAALCAHLDQVRMLEADLPLAANTGSAPVTVKLAISSDSLASWFTQAATGFARASGLMLDLTLEDEAHTADRLRLGEVVGAITADPEAVQGCRTVALGTLRYLACASPEFTDRHFAAGGVNAQTLATAPHLRFDSRDALQARWAREVHGVELDGLAHWVPSTRGFLDFALAGLAWGLHPAPLIAPYVADGRMVELPPRQSIGVDLYWTYTRLHAQALQPLTEAIRRAAADNLAPPV